MKAYWIDAAARTVEVMDYAGPADLQRMVGGNIERHTRVLTTAIVLETGRGRFGLALALGAVLMALALAANVVIFRLHGRPTP